jgi:hypothetical protein
MRHRTARSNGFSPTPSRSEACYTIWWDMHRRSGSEGWSRAVETSEEEAVLRAERFLKLGFVVYAIKDPKGAVVMDEAQITEHFAARAPLAPRRELE